ncbi:MAG: indolepyruvate ferredoxin oxidoreductase subunit alpha [Candidatus Xenobia bacterium]
MTHVIAQPCRDVKDAACIAVCPVECIYEGPDQFYIHPDECIDCGACISECPVDAIFMDEDLPEQWRPYRRKNADFFKQ